MSEFSQNKKLKYCVFFNFLLLVLLVFLLQIFERQGNGYWNFGPNENLIVISIKIDSWYRYWVLLIFTSIFNISQVLISEIALPILNFSIYNPDKKEIVEFTKKELQFYANSMYMIEAIRNALMVMMTISQVDIAIFGALVREITGIYTVKKLLDEKVFIQKSSIYDKV